MNFIDKKILSDLEINEKVIPKINKTITSYGNLKFNELFKIVYYEDKYLLRRREIIESIIKSPNNIKKIVIELKKIKKYQDNVSWYFADIGKEFKDLYFKKEYFNSEDLLSASNFLKIYMPSIIILVYLIIYIIFRYNGININIKSYFTGIYMSYKMFINGFLLLFIENLNFVSLLTNILVTLYFLYQFYNVYNSFDSSLTHYNKCNDFTNNFHNLKHLINCCKKIYNLDNFLIIEKQSVLKDIKYIAKLFDNRITKFGYQLLLKKNNIKYEFKFNNMLQYIGLIDAFINISNLILQMNYTLPNFDFGKTSGPYINARGLWSPYIDNQVKNDCLLGSPNTIILTGPNTSGKSTYIRNIMLVIFLSQTLGVCCCDYLTFTPFKLLFTYLDIPNISKYKESLFESELLRCMEYCNMLEKLETNEFSFTIIDEMFTATNPNEGIAASYAACEYISSFTNSINIITTHFMQLTDLEKQYPKKFKNMKFKVTETKKGNFKRSYLIENGISNQHIAIQLLKNKGYNNFIIDKALDKLKTLKI